MRYFLCLFLMLISLKSFAQTVSGVVVDEESNPIPATLVMNMTTNQKVYTNLNGEFSINASANDELRFVRQNYDRNSKVINQNDFSVSLKVTLVRMAQEIEEVEVSPLKLTGDLNTDSRNLTKIDLGTYVENAVGVPRPPEKPRETPPPTLEKAGVLGFVYSNLNLNNLYKNISGDARRMRTLYKYEDVQENINWIRQRIPDDYFVEIGIPQEKIPEFLQFSIGIKPEISQAIRATNVSKVIFILDETLPEYLKNK